MKFGINLRLFNLFAKAYLILNDELAFLILKDSLSRKKPLKNEKYPNENHSDDFD